ncbi:MAG: PAS domain S-box protein [Bacteroidetes bacterium]|nr:PAS domain S-box protein [Bacteroidota bacterium]
MRIKTIISALIGFVSGILFLLTIWSITANNDKTGLNIDFIIGLHYSSPLFWFAMDTVPVFLTLACGALGFYYNHRLLLLNKTLQEQSASMNKVGAFVEKIGQGEFNIEYQNGNDSISTALIKMRDNLRKTTQDEHDRQWKMEGMTGLGEVLRSYTDLTELGYHLVVFLVKKCNAIQGAFYTIEEDDSKLAIIRMKASYAYNRKKYLAPEFKIGEGLVGQAAIERDFIYRTEIPDSYFSITSGILGDKKPNSLLIVPCISNDNLYGVIEIASLNIFNALEIEFIKEVCKVIGQTIFNLGVNERTSKLLDEVNKSHKKLHALLENASEIITIYDENEIVRYESPSAKNIIGYTPEETMGNTSYQRVHPKGIESVKEMFRKLKEDPRFTVTIQISYIRKDNSKIWLEATGKNMLHDPAIRGIIVNSRDITEKRKAEKEQRLRGQMQSLSENSHDLILRIGIDENIFYINPTVESLTGKKPAEYLQKPFSSVDFPNSIIEEWKKDIEVITKENRPITKELVFPTINGEKIMQINIIPEYNEKKLETLLIVSHDITEQKKNENRINEQNKKITESINYAQRIQNSIIPTEATLRQHFPDSFMFYKPKDVVSGDFPWMFVKDDEIYVATVDCTGHGVPGALMSFIGHFTLNQVLTSEKLPNAGATLDLLHQNVQQTLRQDTGDSKSRDGMDIALCRINLKKKELHYSGAHRPLYYLKQDNNGFEFNEVKADRYPIGGFHYKNREKFKDHVITFKKGESIFFFTDGLPDQFGGPDGKTKFMSNRVQEFVKKNNSLHMNKIGTLIHHEFEQWKGNHKQMDDVLLIGIRF